MSDRLDEIERLNALRERGTLSDEEFERAKHAVLGGDDRVVRKIPGWAMSLGTTIVVVICVFVIKPMLNGAEKAQTAEPATTAVRSSRADNWTVQTKTDPMTDAKISTATTKLIGRAGDIELTVTCSTTGQITYHLASFDKAGEPVAVRSELNANFTPQVRYQVRIGEAAPVAFNYFDPKFSNVIEAETFKSDVLEAMAANGRLDTNVDDMAKATRVTFAIPLAHSDEVLIADQTAASFGATVRPCVDIRTDKIAELTQRYRLTGRAASPGDAK